MSVLAALSLFVGKYPLALGRLLDGDAMQWRVFWTLRFSRTVVGIGASEKLSVLSRPPFQSRFHSTGKTFIANGFSALPAVMLTTGVAAVSSPLTTFIIDIL